MSIESLYEKEERLLEEQYERGEITTKEFTTALNELRRDHQAAAQEAAEQAYRDELERWKCQ